jgi:hypothetical protein
MTCDIREPYALVWEFSNITCHGIVSNKGMEFQYHMSWYCFKQGHGVPISHIMVLFQARAWSSNITCHGIVSNKGMEF